MIGFDLLARDCAARRAGLTTAFGNVQTPCFMPVGTAATVKAMTFDMVSATISCCVQGRSVSRG